MIYDLLKFNEIKTAAAGSRIKVSLSIHDFLNYIINAGCVPEGHIVYNMRGPYFNLFGTALDMGALRFTLTDARLVSTIDFVNNTSSAKADGKISMEWEGGDGSQLIITRI